MTKAYYKFEQKISWFDAWNFCRELGLLLASVDSEAQQSGLQEFLKSDRVRQWWLSGSNLFHQNQTEFSWMSSGRGIPKEKSGNTTGYQNWSMGQPDNHLKVNQNCLRLWDNKGIKSKWDDNPCTKKYNFICERTSN